MGKVSIRERDGIVPISSGIRTSVLSVIAKCQKAQSRQRGKAAILAVSKAESRQRGMQEGRGGVRGVDALAVHEGDEVDHRSV